MAGRRLDRRDCRFRPRIFLTVGAKVAIQKEPEFAGHPKGLYMLFFAEMWERFSYYGMRALLIFYLTQHWLFNDGKSNLIYGAYTSLVYITPVLGGYLADRYLGQRKAVLFGGVLLAVGHFLMAVEGVGGQADPTINVFWLALAFIIVGSGFLKANISVMVGQLYKLTDIRRDGAYTIFYMGINLGAAIGTILVGYLGQTIGWGYGFGLPASACSPASSCSCSARSALRGAGEAPGAARAGRRNGTLYGVGLAAVAVIWALIQYQDVIQSLLIVSGIALLGYVLYESFKLRQGAARPDLRDPVPDRAQPALLGPVRAGRRIAEPVHRPLRRPRRRSGVDLPVDQPDLHHPARAVVRRAVGDARQARARAFGPAKFGLALAADGPGFLVLVWGAEADRRRGDDARSSSSSSIYLLAHHRRALPVAGRPVGDEPAGADVPGLADHGRLVLHDRGRQFRRRQDRRSDRRRMAAR